MTAASAWYAANMPRRRTSTDPYAALRGRLPDVQVRDGQALTFLDEPDEWLPSTTAAYLAFQLSEAARALRAEDLSSVVALFRFVDRRDRLLDELDADPKTARIQLLMIRTMQGCVDSLASQLG
jgi:hypothetical protein